MWSQRTKGVIINEMEKVTRRLNEKRANVSRKVGNIMSSSTLEWLRKYDAAVANGDQSRLVRQICRKLRKGRTVAQIAEDLEEDEIRVQAICNEVARFAPDYDEEQVVKAVLGSVEA